MPALHSSSHILSEMLNYSSAHGFQGTNEGSSTGQSGHPATELHAKISDQHTVDSDGVHCTEQVTE